MTNLLKRTVEKASVASSKSSTNKYIKMPVFSSGDNTDVVLRKLNDYKAKVRLQSGETIIDDVVARFEKTENVSFIPFDELLLSTDGQVITENIINLCIKAARTSVSRPEIISLLEETLIIKINEQGKEQHYCAVVDDTKVKLKAKYELGKYYYPSQRKLHYFGVVSLSSLETISELELKEPFSSRFSTLQAIKANVLSNYEESFFDELNNVLSFDNGRTIATVRSDKKYQDTELNQSTIFNQLGFNKVEVDTAKYEGTEFDYKAFKTVEKDWESICNLLPHTFEPELKFRKLGKHKATGLYYPLLDIVAVDIRATNSFVHEYGHHIDYTYANGNSALSRQDDFQDILYGYKNEYVKLIRQDNVNPYYVKKKNYFITPTEVFARGFEMWAYKRIADKPNSLYKTSEELTTLEYQPYYTMLDQVIDYFDKLLEENKVSDYKEYSVKLQPKDLKSVAQLSFREVEPTIGGDQLSLF